uniref:Purinergic receptor P2Y13 n=2 Tax=Oncorhynchus mykiss TaxID=8022 RepID=A0A8C7WH38_ONCMY
MTSNLTSPLFLLDCGSFNYHDLDVVIPCLYFAMFPLALMLNGVASWVSLHLSSTSTFMVYLKNLLAADLLMTLTMPIVAASKLPTSSVGLRLFSCRYSGVIFYTCMYTSITLLGLISLDRFFKIVRPCGRLLGQNLVFGKVLSVSVWVALFGATALPTIILTNQGASNKTDASCMSMKSPAGVRLHTVVVVFMDVLFWAVSILVVVCYMCITNKVLQSFRNSGSENSQGKQKTKVRVFLVLVVFSVCFIPFHIMRIPRTIQQTNNVNGCSQVSINIAQKVTLWLSTVNICLDPLLYFFLCREFKEKLMGMLKRKGTPSQMTSGTT